MEIEYCKGVLKGAHIYALYICIYICVYIFIYKIYNIYVYYICVYVCINTDKSVLGAFKGHKQLFYLTGTNTLFQCVSVGGHFWRKAVILTVVNHSIFERVDRLFSWDIYVSEIFKKCKLEIIILGLTWII